MILFHTHGQFKTESKQSGGTEVVQSGGTKVVQSDDTTALTDRQEQIVKLLRENPNLSVRKLASILGLNSSAVQKHLNTLKEKKLIQRIGGTRGSWKIKNGPLYIGKISIFIFKHLPQKRSQKTRRDTDGQRQ